jgi:hypothetical protein
VLASDDDRARQARHDLGARRAGCRPPGARTYVPMLYRVLAIA